jgi:two-component system, cell cycle sensor histidine kinase and response regulator CckA
LLEMGLLADQKRDECFKAMKRSSHRMSNLTNQLLAYAQGGKHQPKNRKLDDFMMETLPIFQHDLNPAIRVETVFPMDLPYVEIDQTQMQMRP